MSNINPSLEWYAGESVRRGLPTQRCPFASVHRCPRYYQSRIGETRDGYVRVIRPSSLTNNLLNAFLYPGRTATRNSPGCFAPSARGAATKPKTSPTPPNRGPKGLLQDRSLPARTYDAYGD